MLVEQKTNQSVQQMVHLLINVANVQIVFAMYWVLFHYVVPLES